MPCFLSHQEGAMDREDFTILVIDDDPAIVDVTTAILNEAGFPALGTTDPDEAIRLVETVASIRVLLSDVMMPNTTGPEIFRRAQRVRNGSLRVLFMTGGFEGVHVRQTDRILEKPWSRAELLREVRRILSEDPEHVPWNGPERRRSAA